MSEHGEGTVKNSKASAPASTTWHERTTLTCPKLAFLTRDACPRSSGRGSILRPRRPVRDEPLFSRCFVRAGCTPSKTKCATRSPSTVTLPKSSPVSSYAWARSAARPRPLPQRRVEQCPMQPRLHVLHQAARREVRGGAAHAQSAQVLRDFGDDVPLNLTQLGGSLRQVRGLVVQWPRHPRAGQVQVGQGIHQHTDTRRKRGHGSAPLRCHTGASPWEWRAEVFWSKKVAN